MGTKGGAGVGEGEGKRRGGKSGGSVGDRSEGQSLSNGNVGGLSSRRGKDDGLGTAEG